MFVTSAFYTVSRFSFQSLFFHVSLIKVGRTDRPAYVTAVVASHTARLPFLLSRPRGLARVNGALYEGRQREEGPELRSCGVLLLSLWGTSSNIASLSEVRHVVPWYIPGFETRVRIPGVNPPCLYPGYNPGSLHGRSRVFPGYCKKHNQKRPSGPRQL